MLQFRVKETSFTKENFNNPSYMNIDEQSLEIKVNSIDQMANSIPAIIIIHQLQDLMLKYMSPNGLELLNVRMEEIIDIPIVEYNSRFFNPEDANDYAPKIQNLIQNGDKDEMVSYFQQVRASESHEFKWYLTTSKIFHYDTENIPSHIISFAHPIDPQHHLTNKVSRLIEENNYLKKNQHKLASLTKREKEIISFMAKGESSGSISHKLHISEDTVSTHRKNIKQKLGLQSSYELIKFAQAFDLI